MTNLLANPSFETAAAWALTPGAGYDPSAAKTGTRGLVLIALNAPEVVGGPTVYREGRASQTVELVAGVYGLSVYARRDTGTEALAVEAAAAVVAGLSSSEGDASWTLVSGMFAGSGATEIGIAARVANEAPTSGTFSCDDAALWRIEMARGAYDRYKALFDAIRGINGSAGGYHTSLGNRVISRLVKPGDQGAPRMPYACVIPHPEQPSDDFEGRHITSIFRALVTLYCPDSESAGADRHQTILNLHDDVLRAIMPSTDPPVWSLGAAGVDDVRLVRKAPMSGLSDGFQFGELQMEFDLTSNVGRGDLGSGA